MHKLCIKLIRSGDYAKLQDHNNGKIGKRENREFKRHFMEEVCLFRLCTFLLFYHCCPLWNAFMHVCEKDDGSGDAYGKTDQLGIRKLDNNINILSQ